MKKYLVVRSEDSRVICETDSKEDAINQAKNYMQAFNFEPYLFELSGSFKPTGRFISEKKNDKRKTKTLKQKLAKKLFPIVQRNLK